MPAAAPSLNDLSPRPVTSNSRPTVLPAPSASAVAIGSTVPVPGWHSPVAAGAVVSPPAAAVVSPPAAVVSAPAAVVSAPAAVVSAAPPSSSLPQAPATSARLAASAATPMRLRRKRMPSPFVVECVLRHATRRGPLGARMAGPAAAATTYGGRHGGERPRSRPRRPLDSSPLWSSPPFSSACSSRSSSWWRGSCDPSRPAGRSSSWSPATSSTAGGASTSTTAAIASSSPR